MGKRKIQGLYCKICGQRKSNESFSGTGHANHNCKSCSRLSSVEQAEAIKINRLISLPCRRLTEEDQKWLKNRTKDFSEEVRTVAREIYKQCFPYAERNSRKKQLSVSELEFVVNTSVWDELGDEIPVHSRFHLKKDKPVISMQSLYGPPEKLNAELCPGEFSKLLKALINYYEIFCWNEDYSFNEYDDADHELGAAESSDLDFFDCEKTTANNDPTWCVVIRYGDDTEQSIMGLQEYLPDKVEELFWNLFQYFYEEENDFKE
ncbi:hypothetical protein BN3456_00631 [Clostridium sp. C105KSO13]|nr:hypothetical protein BN3456_00631 [Clostridium sp. C105KSO13]